MGRGSSGISAAGSGGGTVSAFVPNVPINAAALTDTQAQNLRDMQDSSYDASTTAAVKQYISNTNFDGQGHSLSQTMNFLESEGVDLATANLAAVNKKYGLHLTANDWASMQYTSAYMGRAVHPLGVDTLLQRGAHDDMLRQANPGLASRMKTKIHFEDYSADEMLAILDLQLKKGQYQLTDEARVAVKDYIVAANTSSIAFGNARGVRNIFERLLVAQANRLAEGGDLTKDDLMTITEADVAAARASDEKMIAAEKAQQELIQSAEDTIAELKALSKDVKVKLDLPEGVEEPDGNVE